MGDKSKIQWTEATWNPWHGCHKISAGCKYCYMFRNKTRYGQDPNIVVKSKSNFNIPKKWTEPRVIFTCSWSDWFIEEADEWRNEAWEVIKQTPQHTYQILTKRPENIADRLPKDWGEGYKNVWLGVSIEDDSQGERSKQLAKIPAQTRFISYEPLLGQVNHLDYLIGDVKHQRNDQIFKPRIHWLIIGGESGNDKGKFKYRPCEIGWIEKIIDDAKQTRTPVFVKQLGTYLAKKLSLRDNLGGNIEEFPEHLRIREYPLITGE